MSRVSAGNANRVSNGRMNSVAASALSITIKSLSCRLRPDAERFAPSDLVRLPDREIGSADFNDGLAKTNEGAGRFLGADQLKAALASICAKRFQRSHDSSRTT